jgi:outer membrane protein assembly factor BamB
MVFVMILPVLSATALAENFKPPVSRFPPGMREAPVPDDSESARQAAIERLRSAPRKPVCPGASSAATSLLGTQCGTREFDAPPLLTAPKMQWIVNRGWWGANPFTLVGNKLISYSCGNETNKGITAFEMPTGKVLWNNKQVCELRGDANGGERFFVLPDDTLLLAVGWGSMHFDLKTGKLLKSETKKLNTWNLQLFDGTFVSHGRKSDFSHLSGRNLDRGKPLWSIDAFRAKCPTSIADSDCTAFFSNPAYSDGILYISAASKNQGDLPFRQLHAIDVRSGNVLWHHEGQPVIYQVMQGGKRSDDGSPMLVGGKVITRVDGLAGYSYGFRALDAKTGREIWTTAPIPGSFQEEWPPRARLAQTGHDMGAHLVSGDMLIVLVFGTIPGHRELWAYRLADGRPAWRRPLPDPDSPVRLTPAASAGGVIYLMDGRIIMALDGDTGTQLWTWTQPTDNDYPTFSMSGGEVSSRSASIERGEINWPRDWTIGPDGAFYGTTAQGPFKIR